MRRETFGMGALVALALLVAGLACGRDSVGSVAGDGGAGGDPGAGGFGGGNGGTGGGMSKEMKACLKMCDRVYGRDRSEGECNGQLGNWKIHQCADACEDGTLDAEMVACVEDAKCSSTGIARCIDDVAGGDGGASGTGGKGGPGGTGGAGGTGSTGGGGGKEPPGDGNKESCSTVCTYLDSACESGDGSTTAACVQRCGQEKWSDFTMGCLRGSSCNAVTQDRCHGKPSQAACDVMCEFGYFCDDRFREGKTMAQCKAGCRENEHKDAVGCYYHQLKPGWSMITLNMMLVEFGLGSADDICLAGGDIVAGGLYPTLRALCEGDPGRTECFGFCMEVYTPPDYAAMGAVPKCEGLPSLALATDIEDCVTKCEVQPRWSDAFISCAYERVLPETPQCDISSCYDL